MDMPSGQKEVDQTPYNQCSHGDALSIAHSAPLQGRACCKRYELQGAVDGV